MLICISESTRQEVKHLFPGKLTALVRHQIDVDYWNPDTNPQPLDIISEFYDLNKIQSKVDNKKFELNLTTAKNNEKFLKICN